MIKMTLKPDVSATKREPVRVQQEVKARAVAKELSPAHLKLIWLIARAAMRERVDNTIHRVRRTSVKP